MTDLFSLRAFLSTAGVLRGEKARFQLFGDTMNTTARIETTGQKNKIHVSQETGDLLIAAGKGHWLRDREDKVHAKGKGELTTYWLNVKSSDGQSSSGSSDKDASEYDAHVDVAKYAEVKEAKPDQNENVAEDGGFLPQKHLRLVDWNAEILAKILREVVVRRESSGIAPSSVAELRKAETDLLHSGKIVIEEVEEVIALPEFNAQAAKNARDSTDVDLGDAVMEQLRDYVRTLAAM